MAIACAYCLHPGELSALMVSRLRHDGMLLTDDSAARLACVHMGIKAHGTLGLLLRAVRRKQKTPAEIKTLIRAIPSRTSLFIRGELLDRAVYELSAHYDV